MPNINILDDGDVPYPQYSVTQVQGLTIGIQLEKGKIYTKNPVTGLIIVTDPTDFDVGMFQSLVKTDIDSVVGDEAQFLLPRSRIIRRIKDGETLVSGEDVSLDGATGFIIAGAKTDALYLGKVFEIYTRNTNLTKKKITVDNDRVVIDTVGI